MLSANGVVVIIVLAVCHQQYSNATDIHSANDMSSATDLLSPDIITVETGIIADPPMTQFLKTIGKDTIEKKTDYILAHWNEVQLELSRRSQLKYNIKVEIKYINFLDTYPEELQSTTSLLNLLKSMCSWQETLNANVDFMFIYTGQEGIDGEGLAYQSSACRPKYRCGIAKVSDISTSFLQVHEIGHSIGMYDGKWNSRCAPPNDGIMGTNVYGWSTCTADELQAFIKSPAAHCLFETNVVHVTEVLRGKRLIPEYLAGSTLIIPEAGIIFMVSDSGIIRGEAAGYFVHGVYVTTYSDPYCQLKTENEVCEFEHGSGYENRPYPQQIKCGYRSCVDLNPGPHYGTIINHVRTPRGRYCGSEKVCRLNNQCVEHSDIGITDYEVVTGGWSDWTGYSLNCSRSCGTGIRYAKRFCINPRPRNSPDCEGSAFKGELCNTNPCPGDSPDIDTLIMQRSAETCSRLIANNIIDGNKFEETGRPYSSNEIGACEVKCNTKNGYKANWFSRYAILPNGTPCKIDGLDKQLLNQNSGTGTYYCVEGKCTMFGCDGAIGTRVDDCSVCGGDSSTCRVVEEIIEPGKSVAWEYIHFSSIPPGAFNLQITADQRDQPNVWFDIMTESYDIIIDGFNSGFHGYERTPYRNQAGADWYYFPDTQHIYVKGPLKERVEFSVMQMSVTKNALTRVKYSLPGILLEGYPITS